VLALSLNTLANYHIHVESSRNNHLNDDYTVVQNKIFEAIQKKQTAPTPIPSKANINPNPSLQYHNTLTLPTLTAQ
jgi:hypothetical protein